LLIIQFLNCALYYLFCKWIELIFELWSMRNDIVMDEVI
jgi:hypothetical protein